MDMVLIQEVLEDLKMAVQIESKGRVHKICVILWINFPIGQLNKSQTKDRAESMASSAEWDFSCSELACQLKLGGRPID